MFLKLYVIESLWLAPPIRLYTAISLREVCALTWGDFKEHKIGFCQFIITNVVDDKGQCTTHVASSEKGFRSVPIPQELALMLKERKRYLIDEKGIQEKDLIGMPIILENERVKKRFCRPHVAAKVCREIISAIGIEPNIVQLPDDNQGAIAIDLNRYYGDIFRSNYKYRANHTAMLDRGEINYILGIEAPDTYSQHYGDYLNNFTSFGMTKKLHRWAEQHSSVQLNYQFSHEEWESQETLYERVHSSKSGIIKLEETIAIDPDENEEYIDITIYAQHGFIGEIDFLKGENMCD